MRYEGGEEPRIGDRIDSVSTPGLHALVVDLGFQLITVQFYAKDDFTILGYEYTQSPVQYKLLERGSNG